jgi:hypothetical protein
MVEAAIHFDTWEGLTLLVARLGLAPFPYYSSPLKKERLRISRTFLNVCLRGAI